MMRRWLSVAERTRAHFAILVLSMLVAVSACSSEPRDAALFGEPIPIELPVPDGAGKAGVASIAWSGSAWYAAGSFYDAEDQHRPGLWTSADTQQWTRIETVPVTHYGTISELYSVAASERGVVAIGAATGGFHANPRTVSWILDDDGTLHEVPASFELYNGIRQISVRAVTDGPSGWVIIGSRVNQNDRIGATSWTSPVGDKFTIHDDDPALSSSPEQQTFGFDVAQVGGEIIAVGERTQFGEKSGETDGIAWSSADGTVWQQWAPAGLDLGGAGTQRLNRISSSGTRVLITGSQSDGKPTTITAWSTTNGSTWNRATVTPFGITDDVLSNATATATTDEEFIVAARVGDTLHVATSTDGADWHELTVADDLPIGNRASMSVGTDGTTLLVGAASLDGGGLWRLTKG